MIVNDQTLHSLKAWNKANPKKIIFMIHESQGQNTQRSKLNISEIFIIFTKSVTLLGITINDKLHFRGHVDNICK